MSSAIFFVNRWFGLFPYKFSNCRIEFCSFSACIGIVLSVFAMYSLQRRLINPDINDEDPLTNIMRCLFDIVTVAHSCCTWTISIFFGKSYQRVWALRKKIDERFNKNRHRSYSLLWIFMILFVSIGFFVFDLYYVYGNRDISFWCVDYLPFLVDLFINLNYGFWMEYLIRQLMFLNCQLRSTISRFHKISSSDRIQHLQYISKVYFTLFDLSNELNKIFGSHVIYFFMVYGISFAMNIYELSIEAYSNEGNSTNIHSTISWTLVHFFQLFSIAVYCDCVNTKFAEIQLQISHGWKIVPVFDPRLSAQV